MSIASPFISPSPDTNPPSQQGIDFNGGRKTYSHGNLPSATNAADLQAPRATIATSTATPVSMFSLQAGVDAIVLDAALRTLTEAALEQLQQGEVAGSLFARYNSADILPVAPHTMPNPASDGVPPDTDVKTIHPVASMPESNELPDLTSRLYNAQDKSVRAAQTEDTSAAQQPEIFLVSACSCLEATFSMSGMLGNPDSSAAPTLRIAHPSLDLPLGPPLHPSSAQAALRERPHLESIDAATSPNSPYTAPVSSIQCLMPAAASVAKTCGWGLGAPIHMLQSPLAALPPTEAEPLVLSETESYEVCDAKTSPALLSPLCQGSQTPADGFEHHVVGSALQPHPRNGRDSSHVDGAMRSRKVERGRGSEANGWGCTICDS